MRVLLIGGHGMLGSDIAAELMDADLSTPTSEELDIRDAESVLMECRRVRPDLVISTAAFHRVDDSETHPDVAFQMNAVATRNLAVAAREVGAVLVWVSTDYVFDGKADAPYDEDSPACPVCVYGVSKHAGEEVIRLTTDDHLILRTSGLYGVHIPVIERANFADTMLRLWRSGRREVQVVNDQVCTPTNTADLAKAAVKLLRTGARGTFHITNSGECSWAAFADELFRLIGSETRVKHITSAEYPSPARRPAYSVLGHRRLHEAGVESPREWREALAEFLKARLTAHRP